MIDPSAELQGKIVLALRSGVPLVSGRVFDEPPIGAQLPYIGLGVSQIVEEGIEEFDGAALYVTIDAWTTGVGRKKSLKSIGKQVIETLEDGWDKLGPRVKSIELESAHYFEEPDGETSHGAFTFHILTD